MLGIPLSTVHSLPCCFLFIAHVCSWRCVRWMRAASASSWRVCWGHWCTCTVQGACTGRGRGLAAVAAAAAAVAGGFKMCVAPVAAASSTCPARTLRRSLCTSMHHVGTLCFVCICVAVLKGHQGRRHPAVRGAHPINAQTFQLTYLCMHAFAYPAGQLIVASHTQIHPNLSFPAITCHAGTSRPPTSCCRGRARSR
jgi:hypothetical protein